MFVKNVNVKKYESGKLRGFASVDFALRKDGDVAVTIPGWKLFADDDGTIQIGAPSIKDSKGTWQNTLFFYTKKNEDAQKFLDYVSGEARVAYNALIAEEAKKEAQPEKAQGLDDDLPF
jgi:hypothetical protein